MQALCDMISLIRKIPQKGDVCMKRLVRTVLAAACAAAVLVSSALPAFGERDIPGDLTTGTLEFYFRAERRLQYYYSDEYFSVSATEMNEHLRTMSLDLSFVSFVSADTAGASGVRALFEEIGFSAGDMQVDQLDIRPGKDTIGSVICHKKTPYGEVVAVSVRGAAYGEEWANSLLLGDSGDAKGFSSAAEEVLKRLRAYEEKYGLKGAKLWITGYSRGGGVADLHGGDLLQAVGGVQEHPQQYEPQRYSHKDISPAGGDVQQRRRGAHRKGRTESHSHELQDGRRIQAQPAGR